MGYLDHIAACNRHDIARFRPFVVEGRRVGWVRHDTARLLQGFPEAFEVTEARVAMNPVLALPEERTLALDRVAETLHREHGYPRLRGERYLVAARWGDAPVMTIDRGWVSVFGVRAYGVHVNGVVDRADGLHLWIGRRAKDKSVAPGRLDNMVAGGQPAGLGLFENLLKEAQEEADIPRAIAATARAVGTVSYCLEDEWGLKPDTMFCFDLDVPEYFTPRNTDGEIEDFRLMPVEEVARMVRDTDEFKFNVNLVILDFMIRRGILTPDDDADYVDIARGLRQG